MTRQLKVQNKNIEKICVETLTKLDNITETIREILKESVNKIDNIIELNSPKNEILKNKIERVEFICQDLNGKVSDSFQNQKVQENGDRTEERYDRKDDMKMADDIEESIIRNDENNADKEHFSKDQSEFNGNSFWLIGSSLVKDMKTKLIYRYKKTRMTTLGDKTVQGAT